MSILNSSGFNPSSRTWEGVSSWVFHMSWPEHSNQLAPADLPYLGAREITSFHGVLANDNGSSGTPTRKAARAGYGLPIMAFASGLGAASVATFAQHLLGL
jgi:hypothetical protein